MGRRRAGVAVLGGTFDRLHVGHRALLARAFEVADQVGIGITTDRYLARHAKPLAERILSYETRRRRLRSYLNHTFPDRRFWLAPLEDTFGRSVEPGIDVLVASADSVAGARAVNRERARRHLPALRLSLVPLVRAGDGLSVSSRRVRAGRIDPDGRRRSPLEVVIHGPVAMAAVRQAFVASYPTLPVPRIRRGPPGHRTVSSRARRSSGLGPDYVVWADRRGTRTTLHLESASGSWTTRATGTAATPAAIARLVRRARAP